MVRPPLCLQLLCNNSQFNQCPSVVETLSLWIFHCKNKKEGADHQASSPFSSPSGRFLSTSPVLSSLDNHVFHLFVVSVRRIRVTNTARRGQPAQGVIRAAGPGRAAEHPGRWPGAAHGAAWQGAEAHHRHRPPG